MVYFSHLKLSKCPEVYSPQEDTWFLTDILEVQFHQRLFTKSSSLIVCEVGVGSGFISIVLAKRFPRIHFIGVDISPQSSILCRKNMSNWLHPNQYDVVCMDLLRGFNPLKFHPAIVFFNPPYVRTSQEELEKGLLEKTWAGGPSGLAVIHEFLENLAKFSFGKAFFLSSIFNENELFKTNFQRIFELQVIAEREIGDERLLCYEVVRVQPK